VDHDTFILSSEESLSYLRLSLSVDIVLNDSNTIILRVYYQLCLHLGINDDRRDRIIFKLFMFNNERILGINFTFVDINIPNSNKPDRVSYK